MSGSMHRMRERKALRLIINITEQWPDAIITTDLNSKIYYTNKAFQSLYSYLREELVGQTPEILNAEPDSGRIQTEIYTAVSSGKYWKGELLNRKKDAVHLIVSSPSSR